MSKQKLKSLIMPKKILLNLKVSSNDLREIKSNALKYAGGNTSAWIRHAAMNYKPAKKELANA